MAYSPRDLVAAEPQWHFVDFERQALQISYALQARKTRCIALWLEDAAHLACVLLGAWHARVRVLFSGSPILNSHNRKLNISRLSRKQ